MAIAGLLDRNRRFAPAVSVRADIVPLPHRACSVRHFDRGESLCSVGEAFRALFVVRSGNLKSYVVSRNGLVQVTGFQVAGDIVGLDGIDRSVYQSDVVALADAEAFVVPFVQCEQWSRESAYAQHLLMRTLARETYRSHQHMLALGTMRAEQRMAIFLLDLSQRYGRLGLSRSEFVLGMLRQDIGSYLGLTLETVSRLLSRMQRDGLLQVQGKAISLLDFPMLWRLAGTTPENDQHLALDPIVDREGNLATAH
jgi:CRP/FNR family transcriptional regulator